MNKSFKYYYIYEIYNILNNKSYIGWHATNNLNDDYFGSGKYLKRAIHKYGEKYFKKEIIQYCNEIEILEKEIFWIKEKNSFAPNGYNLTFGGDGSLGRICALKTKEKMRKSMSRKKLSEETKRKLSEAHKGKIYKNYKSHPISEETKQKISKANKGRKHTIQARKNMSQGQKGKKLSEETKQKLSKSLKGLTHNLKLVICPYCNLSGKGPNMTRYHLDNCKYFH